MMTYKRYAREINEILSKNISKIETYGKLYDEFKNKIATMRNNNVYTKDFIDEYEKKNDITKSLQEQVKNDIDSITPSIEYLLSQIKKNLDDFFCGSATKDFADKLSAIKMSGITLSNHEIEILHNQAKTYLDLRMLHQIAIERTRTSNEVELGKDGNYYNVQKERLVDDIGLFELPDMEKTYRAFERYSSQVKQTKDFYSGTDFKYRNLYDNAPVFALVDDRTNVIASNAFEEFNKVVSEATKCLPENNRKTKLTDKDVELIDSLIDPKYPTLVKSDVQKYAKLNPELAQLFVLDERYWKYVDEIRDEVF